MYSADERRFDEAVQAALETLRPFAANRTWTARGTTFAALDETGLAPFGEDVRKRHGHTLSRAKKGPLMTLESIVKAMLLVGIPVEEVRTRISGFVEDAPEAWALSPQAASEQELAAQDSAVGDVQATVARTHGPADEDAPGREPRPFRRLFLGSIACITLLAAALAVRSLFDDPPTGVAAGERATNKDEQPQVEASRDDQLEHWKVGYRVAGSRASGGASMQGIVIASDHEQLVVEVRERWVGKRSGRVVEPVYRWRFERAEHDPRTGICTLALRDMRLMSPGDPKHRQHFGGRVELRGHRLVGSAMYSWSRRRGARVYPDPENPEDVQLTVSPR